MCNALFVDLDGTLIDGDLLRNAAMSALKRLGFWPACILGLCRGRAALKESLSQRVRIAPETLSYRWEVLAFIHRRRAAGSRIVLATATAERWAATVAEYLGCFDDVLSSTPAINLKGTHKLAAIQEYCRVRNITGFGYIGDSFADLAIWRAADEVILAAPRRGLSDRLNAMGRKFAVLTSESVPSGGSA